MPDNPKDRGAADRASVSDQVHELDYLAEKFGISREQAAAAQRAVGPNRADVERYIESRRKG